MQFVNSMRGIAILLILATHAISAFQVRSFGGGFLDYIIGNGTILFMFISGYLFAATREGFSYLPYLKNKLLVVVLPYVILSAPAILLYTTGLKTDHNWVDMTWFSGLNPFERYAYMLVTGAALGPMWFIPMIVLYFICAPFFANLGRSKWLLISLFLISIGLALLVERPEGNSNTIRAFLFFLPSYLLGIIVFNNQAYLKKAGPLIYILSGLYIAIYIGLYFFYYKQSPDIDQSSNMIFYLPVAIIMAAACFHFIKKKNALLDMFARLSFFIYFIHGYFIAASRPLLVKIDLGGPVNNIFLEIFIILSVSTIVIILCISTYIVLKLILGKHSRYIIGA